MSGYLIAIAAMGLVTLLCRAAPFIFFMRSRPPAVLDFVQRFIPPMIMTILVLNSFKGLRLDRAPFGLPEIASALVVAALQLWRRNALLSIVGGTALYMVLIRLG
ncbi:MAG TPA: AzlD domain-containing protein [Rectinemataceae bacterium]|nr:AzlD domain-containing protein [Rectinemataceae bacterium]